MEKVGKDTLDKATCQQKEEVHDSQQNILEKGDLPKSVQQEGTEDIEALKASTEKVGNNTLDKAACQQKEEGHASQQTILKKGDPPKSLPQGNIVEALGDHKSER